MRDSIFGIGALAYGLLAVACGGSDAPGRNGALESAGAGGQPATGADEPSGRAGQGATADASGAECPAVYPRRTFARISADFPLPFEAAQMAVFSACRNDECQPVTLQPDVEGDPSPGVISGNAPAAADGFSPEPAGVRVVVWAATGKPYAPKAPYVSLEWQLKPESDDYTRTDTYTLTADQGGVRTELIHLPVTYTKTMFDARIGAPDPTQCDTWGEAVVDLRTAD